ncbi:MAG TPA: aminotransferase class I/II-fold pyridoxal phosphate-dependent enzyme, partial [Gemmatimonadales bacterium]|nr:aminotransferase class I/II-fold pyridoxal phosphate-dependent enzyme [Gemmatimonadales bacterium]
MSRVTGRSGLERRLEAELEQFRRDGVYKRLNWLDGPQGPVVRMEGRGDVIILSSNNYLGLCAEPEVVAAGKAALDRFGAGTASVRFICGTFTVHRELEAGLARLVGSDASLSFASCWNANEAVPATLLGDDDIVLSDQLNHASIIDAMRLAKAITKCQTGVYRHADLADLEEKLRAARDRRVRLVITDGVFSMEGAIAPLPALVELCRKHDAVLMVDDS